MNQANVLDYFSERTNPFYDRTCNNEILKMQKLGVADVQLANMQGTEYCLLHVQEPILYVIRKQVRHSPTQVSPVVDYYVIAGVIYQAPDIGSVINSRVLTGVSHLHAAFEEARGYARYHPSRGYWWDFGKEDEDKKRKEIKEKSEEPSSMFQRRRVDMLLDQLTRQFPHKVPQPTPSLVGGEAGAGEVPPQVKQEKQEVAAGGVKRERSEPGGQTESGKKMKS